MPVSPELLSILRCPLDGSPLSPSHLRENDRLVCSNTAGVSHDWPVSQDIPVLLPSRVELEARGYWTQRVADVSLYRASDPDADAFDGHGVHPHVTAIIASTGGYMYRGITLTRYPIPELRMPAGEGRTLLDVGCNWGRWSVAAAKAGYCVTGMDVDLSGLRAARHVAQSCGAMAQFVCADARMMPFAQESFDRVFSYSVVQHFAKAEARVILSEIARVLQPGGETLIQMPNRLGVRSLYHQTRRRFREGQRFDVRYYSLAELISLFRSVIGPSNVRIDGFFGLGIQPSDVDLMPPFRRAVIASSEFLRRRSRRHTWLTNLADSVYVKSRKPLRAG